MMDITVPLPMVKKKKYQNYIFEHKAHKVTKAV